MKRIRIILGTVAATALAFTVVPAVAVPSAKPSVTVTFNANGGTIGDAKTKTVTVKKGKKLGALPKAKKVGNSFKGWFTKKSGGTQVTASTKVTKKSTYYARWAAKTYKLTFDANGGKVGTASKKVVFNKAVGALPKPKRSGYTFNGWYTSAAGGTEFNAKTKMPGESTTLYARWKRPLNATEQKLVGVWGWNWNGSIVYLFKSDGTFGYLLQGQYSPFYIQSIQGRGVWLVDKGTLILFYQYRAGQPDGMLWGPWETEISERGFDTLTFGVNEDGKEYVELENSDSSKYSKVFDGRYIKNRVGLGEIDWSED
ncbi:MAG: InlB B-repeat-containing protein [Micrococcales bacterium]|nr:InlB B-repeat-containing protein [Micrococcales bacterium]